MTKFATLAADGSIEIVYLYDPRPEIAAIEIPIDAFPGYVQAEPDRWVAPVITQTQAEIVASISAAVQAHIDAAARAKGYDSGLSCASYDGDPSPKFAAEAKAFKAWRSSVWTACYATLADVEAGTKVAPSAADLVAGLPVIAWP